MERVVRMDREMTKVELLECVKNGLSSGILSRVPL